MVVGYGKGPLVPPIGGRVITDNSLWFHYFKGETNLMESKLLFEKKNLVKTSALHTSKHQTIIEHLVFL